MMRSGNALLVRRSRSKEFLGLEGGCHYEVEKDIDVWSFGTLEVYCLCSNAKV